MNRTCQCASTSKGCGKPGCRGKSQGCAGITDTSCVYYHLDNNKASLLQCLQIPNGTSLEKILEVIDNKICQIIEPCWDNLVMHCLETEYEVTSMLTFAQAVINEICRLRKPLEVEYCDKYITLTIVDNKIKACLNFDALLDELLTHKCEFGCGTPTAECSITAVTIGTVTTGGGVTYVPITFRVTNPGDTHVIIQLRDANNAVLNDPNVPSPQQSFVITAGSNTVNFVLTDAFYTLTNVKFSLQVGVSCSYLSPSMSIQVGHAPFMTFIESACNFNPSMTLDSVDCSTPTTGGLSITTITCSQLTIGSIGCSDLLITDSTCSDLFIRTTSC